MNKMAKKATKRRYSKGAAKKVGRAMKKRKSGTLKSGRSGKKVKSRKQAIAIGLSKARRAGVKLPPSKGSSEETKEQAERDLRNNKRVAHPVSPRRTLRFVLQHRRDIDARRVQRRREIVFGPRELRAEGGGQERVVSERHVGAVDKTIHRAARVGWQQIRRAAAPSGVSRRQCASAAFASLVAIARGMPVMDQIGTVGTTAARSH